MLVGSEEYVFFSYFAALGRAPTSVELAHGMQATPSDLDTAIQNARNISQPPIISYDSINDTVELGDRSIYIGSPKYNIRTGQNWCLPNRSELFDISGIRLGNVKFTNAIFWNDFGYLIPMCMRRYLNYRECAVTEICDWYESSSTTDELQSVLSTSTTFYPCIQSRDIWVMKYTVHSSSSVDIYFRHSLSGTPRRGCNLPPRTATEVPASNVRTRIVYTKVPLSSQEVSLVTFGINYKFVGFVEVIFEGVFGLDSGCGAEARWKLRMDTSLSIEPYIEMIGTHCIGTKNDSDIKSLREIIENVGENPITDHVNAWYNGAYSRIGRIECKRVTNVNMDNLFQSKWRVAVFETVLQRELDDADEIQFIAILSLDPYYAKTLLKTQLNSKNDALTLLRIWYCFSATKDYAWLHTCFEEVNERVLRIMRSPMVNSGNANEMLRNAISAAIKISRALNYETPYTWIVTYNSIIPRTRVPYRTNYKIVGSTLLARLERVDGLICVVWYDGIVRIGHRFGAGDISASSSKLIVSPSKLYTIFIGSDLAGSETLPLSIHLTDGTSIQIGEARSLEISGNMLHGWNLDVETSTYARLAYNIDVEHGVNAFLATDTLPESDDSSLIYDYTALVPPFTSDVPNTICRIARTALHTWEVNNRFVPVPARMRHIAACAMAVQVRNYPENGSTTSYRINTCRLLESYELLKGGGSESDTLSLDDACGFVFAMLFGIAGLQFTNTSFGMIFPNTETMLLPVPWYAIDVLDPPTHIHVNSSRTITNSAITFDPKILSVLHSPLTIGLITQYDAVQDNWKISMPRTELNLNSNIVFTDNLGTVYFDWNDLSSDPYMYIDYDSGSMSTIPSSTQSSNDIPIVNVLSDGFFEPTSLNMDGIPVIVNRCLYDADYALVDPNPSVIVVPSYQTIFTPPADIDQLSNIVTLSFNLNTRDQTHFRSVNQINLSLASSLSNWAETLRASDFVPGTTSWGIDLSAVSTGQIQLTASGDGWVGSNVSLGAIQLYIKSGLERSMQMNLYDSILAGAHSIVSGGRNFLTKPFSTNSYDQPVLYPVQIISGHLFSSNSVRFTLDGSYAVKHWHPELATYYTMGALPDTPTPFQNIDNTISDQVTTLDTTLGLERIKRLFIGTHMTIYEIHSETDTDSLSYKYSLFEDNFTLQTFSPLLIGTDEVLIDAAIGDGFAMVLISNNLNDIYSKGSGKNDFGQLGNVIESEANVFQNLTTWNDCITSRAPSLPISVYAGEQCTMVLFDDNTLFVIGSSANFTRIVSNELNAVINYALPTEAYTLSAWLRNANDSIRYQIVSLTTTPADGIRLQVKNVTTDNLEWWVIGTNMNNSLGTGEWDAVYNQWTRAYQLETLLHGTRFDPLYSGTTVQSYHRSQVVDSAGAQSFVIAVWDAADNTLYTLGGRGLGLNLSATSLSRNSIYRQITEANAIISNSTWFQNQFSEPPKFITTSPLGVFIGR